MTMMLQILLYSFIRDVSGAPGSVADRPKVPTPVFLSQRGVLLLQPPRGPSFHPLDQIRQRLRRTILDLHLHMVFAYHSLENAYVLGVTYLYQQVSAAQLNVP